MLGFATMDFVQETPGFNAGFICWFLCPRFHLSEEGEWLVKALGLQVERDEDGSVSAKDVGRIQREAMKR